MATKPGNVEYIVEQSAEAGFVSAKKMFGEFAMYCDGKLVALMCNDQLLLKLTTGGRALVGQAVEVPPYPSAKPCFLISADTWNHAEWLRELVAITARELPIPKEKKPMKW
jgi:TfoX/Sxy family transcriptional regulator of competence genes